MSRLAKGEDRRRAIHASKRVLLLSGMLTQTHMYLYQLQTLLPLYLEYSLIILWVNVLCDFADRSLACTTRFIDHWDNCPAYIAMWFGSDNLTFMVQGQAGTNWVGSEDTDGHLVEKASRLSKSSTLGHYWMN